MMGKKLVQRVYAGDEGPKDICLHQSLLISTVRAEFPYQPSHDKKLAVGASLYGGLIGGSAPAGAYKSPHRKHGHHDVDGAGESDSPLLDERHNHKPCRA